MADKIESQNVIERIKSVKSLHSDKEVASLLGLTPADFSNRKKRGSLIPLIMEWALENDLDLNELFKCAGQEGGGAGLGYLKRFTRYVHTMDGSRGPSHWLSDEPVDKIILSDEFCNGVSLAKMSGNSMEPTIHDDAIFAVDCGVTSFSSGQIYVVWIPLDGPVVRRVFMDFEKLILKADNTAYPDITILISEIPKSNFILGRVRWVLQQL